MGRLKKSTKALKARNACTISKRWQNSTKEACEKPTISTSKPIFEENGDAFSRLCLINFKAFWKQVQEIKHRAGSSCSIGDVEVIGWRNDGLNNILNFKCATCGAKSRIETVPTETGKADINLLSTLGTCATGCGYSQMQEYHAALNMPFLSYRSFKEQQDRLENIIDVSLTNVCKKAGELEMRLAKESGQVDKHGIPNIGVISDGTWGKRSFKTNYNSSSGAGAIIGVNTGKILHLGIKNKYCDTCQKAATTNKPPNVHKCYKNWSGTSTSMESGAIVEGFKNSLTRHGLKYTQLISDGDSSVMKKLNEVKPYGPETCIEKVECVNHLLRNFCTKLKAIVKLTKSSSMNKSVPIRLRRIVDKNVLRMRVAVQKASEKRRTENVPLMEKIQLLTKDILNSPSHIFGEHSKCSEIGYFCKGRKQSEENVVGEMKDCGLFNDVMSCLYRLVENASSLLLQQNNNRVESFNNVVCKMVGGKRINFSKSGSYQLRCKLAAISYNTRGYLFPAILSTGFNQDPGDVLNDFLKKRTIQRRCSGKKAKKGRNHCVAEPDADYGAVDMVNSEELAIRKEDFLSTLRLSREEREQLEQATIGQTSNPLWKKSRQNILTSSSFKSICSRKPTTAPDKLIRSLVCRNFSGTKATRFGLEHEDDAIQAFMAQTGLTVRRCGLFVGEADECFLGASPDGVVEEEDAILEVKCPITLDGITIQQGIEQPKTLPYLKKDKITGKITLNTTHRYYFQIQGQLHLTGRQFGYFVIWTNTGGELYIEKIEKSDIFWNTKMKQHLKTFYFDYLLPELLR